jgi:hypothetical protein
MCQKFGGMAISVLSSVLLSALMQYWIKTILVPFLRTLLLEQMGVIGNNIVSEFLVELIVVTLCKGKA